MSWDGGSGYKAYVFKESTRRYAIDRKGRGRKEVIYLRVANISYTRGIRKSTGSPIEAPTVGFRNNLQPSYLYYKNANSIAVEQLG